MTGLSKITDKILEQARADARARLADADKQCAEISASYERRAEEIKTSAYESARREASQIVSRAKSSEAMIRRNTVLEAKADLIDRTFELAKQEILSLSPERYVEMMTRLLIAVLHRIAEDEKLRRETYGEDEVTEVQIYELLLNERDSARCGKELIESVMARIDAEHRHMAEKIKLSDAHARIEGGLILRMGDIEMNCSVEALIGEIRPELESKVNRRLFAERAEKRG